MVPKDISEELWREYEFRTPNGVDFIPYRIVSPILLYVGRTTHRVVDVDGLVHCVPSPGINGCVLRWKPKDASNPVQF